MREVFPKDHHPPERPSVQGFFLVGGVSHQLLSFLDGNFVCSGGVDLFGWEFLFVQIHLRGNKALCIG